MTSAPRQVLCFPNRRKHKMETWWPYCIHSASDYCNNPSATKSNVVVRNFIAKNSWHDKTNCMARRASSCQGQLQRLASQQTNEPALNALISGGKRILHVSRVSWQMHMESTPQQLQSAWLQVHMTSKVGLLLLLPTSYVLVEPGSMSDVLM